MQLPESSAPARDRAGKWPAEQRGMLSVQPRVLDDITGGVATSAALTPDPLHTCPLARPGASAGLRLSLLPAMPCCRSEARSCGRTLHTLSRPGAAGILQQFPFLALSAELTLLLLPLAHCIHTSFFCVCGVPVSNQMPFLFFFAFAVVTV